MCREPYAVCSISGTAPMVAHSSSPPGALATTPAASMPGMRGKVALPAIPWRRCSSASVQAERMHPYQHRADRDVGDRDLGQVQRLGQAGAP